MKKFCVALVFAVAMSTAPDAFAQTTSGVTGVVTDSSNAVVPEARVLVVHIDTGAERSTQWSTLAEIGKRLGRRALAEVAVAAKPDTILGWVPQARRSEVRWCQTTFVSGPATRWTGD
jgi:hypothetical protein